MSRRNNQVLVDARYALEQALAVAKQGSERAAMKQAVATLKEEGRAVVLSVKVADYLLRWIDGELTLRARPRPTAEKEAQLEFQVRLRHELDKRVAKGQDALKVRAELERRYAREYPCKLGRAKRVLEDKTKLRAQYERFGLKLK
jgi:hypothetical protein